MDAVVIMEATVTEGMVEIIMAVYMVMDTVDIVIAMAVITADIDNSVISK